MTSTKFSLATASLNFHSYFTTKSPAVTREGQLYCLYLKANIWLLVAKRKRLPCG